MIKQEKSVKRGLKERIKKSRFYLRIKGYSLSFCRKTGLYRIYITILRTIFRNPSDKLFLIGVTGTNGKTTTTHLIHQALLHLGENSSLLGTLGMQIGQKNLNSSFTTPKPYFLYKHLNKMIREHINYCTMEVSSIGIAEQRVDGLSFRTAIFTNLTQDHLDVHKSMEAYASEKAKLFESLQEDGIAILNGDDPYWESMIPKCRARVILFGKDIPQNQDDKKISEFISFKILENSLNGLKLQIDGLTASFKLIGEFNAYNIAAAYASLISMGYPPKEVLQALSLCNSPEGRMQLLHADGLPLVIIDYAHTPDALEKLLLTVREVKNDNQLISLVFGCGGNRYKKKRPLMGKIAAQLADNIILTANNSRNEMTLDICKHIIAGMSDHEIYEIEEDRKMAIRKAIVSANDDSVIVIAGKGHENYQDLGSQKFYHSDIEYATEVLKTLQATTP